MAWNEGNQIRPVNEFANINEEIEKIEGFIEEDEAKILLYKFFRHNITYATNAFMGVKLFPFQHIAIKTMLDTDYTLNIWSRGLSKCGFWHSLVPTNRGLIQMKDVEVGDYILSKDGVNIIQDKTINPAQKTYKVTTNRGYESEGLDYHRVLTLTENLDLEYKFSKDLKPGDCLVMRKGGVEADQVDIFKNFKPSKRVRKNIITVEPTNLAIDEWYYFFGLLIGDGCFSEEIVSITSNDKEVEKFLIYFAEQLNLNLRISSKKNTTAKSYIISNKSLKEFLKFCGFQTHTKAKNKTIPLKLLQCSKPNSQQLLSGLFDTDGFASASPERRNSNGVKIGFTSSSIELIRQVRSLLLINNITTNTNISFHGGDSNFGNKKYKCNKAWSILIMGFENIKEFKNNIGFRIQRKQSKLSIINNAKYKGGEFSNYIPYIGKYLKKNLNKKSIRNRKEGIHLRFRENTSRKLAKLITKHVEKQHADKIKKLTDKNLFYDYVKSVEEGFDKTVDLQVENEHCYVSDGIINHNSFSCGIYAVLDAIFNQGIQIGILSAAFRQSKQIFRKIEDIASKPEAALLNQLIGNRGISKGNDEWILKIGDSTIRALPLGDGSKLRGFRFHRIIIDEMLLMPERIYNEVILPFLAVTDNPDKQEELAAAEDLLIERGEMTEEERYKWPNNKLIALSSASYKFEYLYKFYKTYENLIINPDFNLENDEGEEIAGDTAASRAIIQLSYDCAPRKLYDKNLIKQSVATMSQSQFDREFGAKFTDDSSGYFKISRMADCTIPYGESPSVEVVGDPDGKYILAFDPSWAENDSSDDFAIHLFKLNDAKKMGTVVHSYALANTRLKEHMKYFLYLIQNFNIVAIIGDSMGGVSFINSCNESKLFKDAGVEIGLLDVNFDKLEDYKEALEEAKEQYNLEERIYCHLQTPTSGWIRRANEYLQGCFDHKKVKFAADSVDSEFAIQKKAKIPILDLKFRNILKDEEQSHYEEDMKDSKSKIVEFIEHQTNMIDLIKAESALIQITTSPQGHQTFDLPKNLRNQSGPNKTRKDSYSAMVLGNWMVKLYYDFTEAEEQNTGTFIPRFLK